ncbi:DNA ligase D [Pseudochryseolinea flava]|uniref:DNA ligase (ATP) n=1 Tax=Pseudochryseolinea flava TaxID=2059302 RepID=A0A364XXZ0_9BACT|nr:DNA ligase D [Pseudochryseolinea flava]RAV99171.1 DNA ligase D [Pseudochryseolinea flava]
MALSKYKKKRSFKSTPEPVGGKPLKKTLRFVVQKHDASHLHYDFRLEMEGVLKSWAVPKGPSMDTKTKRLAMMVEDHPYDYGTFEGIIPEGNYGAGTVMLWDEGTYESVATTGEDKLTQDKDLRKQLRQGKLKFTLHGKKLNGQFALVKSSGRGENAWLLMKLKDDFASSEEILDKDKSVLSRKTIEQLSKVVTKSKEKKPTNGSRKPLKRTTAKKKSAPTEAKIPKKSTTRKKSDTTIQALLDKAKKTSFPKKLAPMLATLVEKPINTAGWQYEIKWDGYRAIGFVDGAHSELRSRNDKSFNEKFYPIYQGIADWNVSAVVDGEIVVLNDKGLSDFNALQNWRSEADGELFYYLFDLLWYDGHDLTALPMHERRAILKSIVPENGSIRYSENFDTTGDEFYALAGKMGLEGIVAKLADSEYHPGQRSREWLKIKTNKRQEVVIGGFTNNDDSSKVFSSLLVGVYDNGRLQYTGKVGTGFSDKTQREMMKQFKPLISKSCPFTEAPDVNKPSRFRPDPPHAKATWLKPELVCEVSYTELTNDGVMRHPSFEGMRIDKKAEQVVAEVETPVAEIAESESPLHRQKILKKSETKSRHTLLNPSEETQVKKINAHEIKFTNLSKIYWPDKKVTKRDMLNYYYQMAPIILPYLKDRPQSLNRFPNGIKGMSFYQKDVTGKVPDWVEQYLYHSEGEKQDKHFMVATNEASVLYMATLGCIEMNPWSSTVHKPDHPDWCVIDLDPAKNNFDKVIEAALVTKQVLDGLAVPSYCKTSGSTGLHIYIPFNAKYTYEQSKEFARVVVTMVNAELPRTTSIERTVSKRGGKIYLDFLQNRPQATLAAAYSLRPKPGAPVSMPLTWDEVKPGLKITDFTIFNAVDRVKETGDLFKPVLGKGISLEKAVKQFE